MPVNRPRLLPLRVYTVVRANAAVPRGRRRIAVRQNNACRVKAGVGGEKNARVKQQGNGVR